MTDSMSADPVAYVALALLVAWIGVTARQLHVLTVRARDAEHRADLLACGIARTIAAADHNGLWTGVDPAELRALLIAYAEETGRA